MNATVSIFDIARAVKFSDRPPTASISSIENILDQALRQKVGMAAMSSEGVVVELGNGYSLHCKTKKNSGQEPA